MIHSRKLSLETHFTFGSVNLSCEYFFGTAKLKFLSLPFFFINILSQNMNSTPLPPVVFENVAAGDISEAMLVEAANLFSNSYGVWGPDAEKNIGPFAKQGEHLPLLVPHSVTHH
jgi:hypothetical protein